MTGLLGERDGSRAREETKDSEDSGKAGVVYGNNVQAQEQQDQEEDFRGSRGALQASGMLCGSNWLTAWVHANALHKSAAAKVQNDQTFKTF